MHERPGRDELDELVLVGQDPAVDALLDAGVVRFDAGRVEAVSGLGDDAEAPEVGAAELSGMADDLFERLGVVDLQRVGGAVLEEGEGGAARWEDEFAVGALEGAGRGGGACREGQGARARPAGAKLRRL